ncbi:type VII toxin-antitoxin system HepT family RNase toxin [Clostridium intestinale]|uniref:Uncharacterized conserved protein YutE, UPF0331/DUF86 family n=1 Tax=Clostridium intestinale DSM 6191 TaxID=1121320 RepID=A0A1M5W0F2_9CLOT|nr:DUF86 domain-containing protein [Clostridium intestinale]SHH80992.1 Uncharacterized conserved protein YutE, UPF0331/DUF86 family [Clostridium intestinale DSM 6191]
MAKDVLFNKIQTIERCISRISEVYDDNPDNLKDYTKQDSIILNIQRACEIVSEKKLGIPQNSRDAFEVLYANNLINESLMSDLKSMVGFRNIAVHDYQSINLSIVEMIIKNHLDDFKKFTYEVNKLV